MSLILGIKDKRVSLSTEALSVDMDTIVNEVNEWANKRRLLGVNDSVDEEKFHVQLSEGSYMHFESTSSRGSYYIDDDTDIIVPMFVDFTLVYTKMPSLSIDLQKYNDTKFKQDILIKSTCDKLDLKLKVMRSVYVQFQGLKRIDAELEGVKDLYNQVEFSTHRGSNAELSIKKVENVMVRFEYEPLILDVSPEQIKEFVSICKGEKGYITLDSRVGGFDFIEVTESDVMSIRVCEVDFGKKICQIKYGFTEHVNISFDKIVSFLYKVQKVNSDVKNLR